MKFAITGVMLLAFFGLSGTAEGLAAETQSTESQGLSMTSEDGRETSSASATTTASVSAPSFTAILTPSPAVPALAPIPAFTPMSALTPVPALTSTASAFVVLKTPPKPHRFFDAQNSLGLTAMAGSLITDALSTQKGLAYPNFHEMNPLARPFVQTRSGAAAYSAGSFALLAGAAYAMHKTHHHKLEHIFPFAVAGWEGFLSARNYHVIAAAKK